MTQWGANIIVSSSFQGSAWERTVLNGSAVAEAEPREHCVPRQSLGTSFFVFFCVFCGY